MRNNNNSNFLSQVVLLIFILACGVIGGKSVISVFRPSAIETAESIEEFTSSGILKYDIPRYANLEDVQLVDTWWYIDDGHNKKETELYIGYIEEDDKYFLVALDSTKEEDEEEITGDLLVSNYDIEELENYEGIVDGIANDLNQEYGMDITRDDFVTGILQIEEDTSEGKFMLGVWGFLAVIFGIRIVLTLRRR